MDQESSCQGRTALLDRLKTGRCKVAIALAILLLGIAGAWWVLSTGADPSGSDLAGSKDRLWPARFADGRWGYIDHHGKKIIAPQFASTSAFEDGYGIAEKEPSGPVIIGRDGNVLLEHKPGIKALGSRRFALLGNPIRFVSFGEKFEVAGEYTAVAGVFQEGLLAVAINDKYGFIDEAGLLAIPATFEDIRLGFSEGLAPVMQGGRWGYIDRAGKWVIPPQFDEANPFQEGLALVRQKSTEDRFRPGSETFTYHYIRRDGKPAFDKRFARATWFSGGLAAVREVNKAENGYIDKTGQYVIRPQFDLANPFEEGLAYARIAETRGYIDRTGRFAIAIEDSDVVFAGSFSDGRALLMGLEWCGYIDRRGRWVWRSAPESE